MTSEPIDWDLPSSPLLRNLLPRLGGNGPVLAKRVSCALHEFVAVSNDPVNRERDLRARLYGAYDGANDLLTELLGFDLLRRKGFPVLPFPGAGDEGGLTPDFIFDFNGLSMVGDGFAIREGLPEVDPWWSADELFQFGLEDDGTLFAICTPRGKKYQRPSKQSLAAFLKEALAVKMAGGQQSNYIPSPWEGVSVSIDIGVTENTLIHYSEGSVHFNPEAGFRQIYEKQKKYRELVDSGRTNGLIVVPNFLWSFTPEDILRFGENLFQGKVDSAPFRRGKAEGDFRRLAAVISIHGGYFTSVDPFLTVFPNPGWASSLEELLPARAQIYNPQSKELFTK